MDISNQMQKRAAKWVITGGILSLVLGAIHNGATFIVFQTDFLNLTWDERMTAIWLFVMTGLALMWAGLTLIFIGRSGDQWNSPMYRVGLLASSFVVLLGLSSVVIMPANPFAWIGFAVGVFALAPFLAYRTSVFSFPSNVPDQPAA